MATRTITAMYRTRAEAERAAEALRGDTTLNATNVSVVAASSTNAQGAAAPGGGNEERGIFGSLRSMFLPNEDQHTYSEGLRRGDILVTASVDDAQAARAMDVLEQHGAVDYQAEERTWRESGWRGYGQDTAGAAGSRSGVSIGDIAGTAAGRATESAEEAIPLVEETLKVGKRDVSHGRVRVRSYIVETPVSEQVNLREEHVSVERRPVDRPAAAGDELFRERTIEAIETVEEAVVGKEARVREEVVLRKDVADRVETVKDTVRRTEVEVDDHGKDANAGIGTSAGSNPETSTEVAPDSAAGTRTTTTGRNTV